MSYYLWPGELIKMDDNSSCCTFEPGGLKLDHSDNNHIKIFTCSLNWTSGFKDDFCMNFDNC